MYMYSNSNSAVIYLCHRKALHCELCSQNGRLYIIAGDHKIHTRDTGKVPPTLQHVPALQQKTLHSVLCGAKVLKHEYCLIRFRYQSYP